MANVNESESSSKSASGNDMNRFLIILLVAIVLLFVVFAGVNYLVVDNLVSAKIQQLNVNQQE